MIQQVISLKFLKRLNFQSHEKVTVHCYGNPHKCRFASMMIHIYKHSLQSSVALTQISVKLQIIQSLPLKVDH